MQKVYLRVGLFILAYIIVATMPWWLSVLFLVCMTIYFPNYVEIIFFGFVFDTLYSSKYPMPFLGLFSSSVFLVLVMLVKTRIRT